MCFPPRKHLFWSRCFSFFFWKKTLVTLPQPTHTQKHTLTSPSCVLKTSWPLTALPRWDQAVWWFILIELFKGLLRSHTINFQMYVFFLWTMALGIGQGIVTEPLWVVGFTDDGHPSVHRHAWLTLPINNQVDRKRELLEMRGPKVQVGWTVNDRQSQPQPYIWSSILKGQFKTFKAVVFKDLHLFFLYFYFWSKTDFHKNQHK